MGIKSFFIKEESGQEETKYKKGSEPPVKTAVDRKPTASIQSIDSIDSTPQADTTILHADSSASADGKAAFVKYYNDQISKAQHTGHYLEFINALKNVESLAVDEKTKFTMIYASFKAQSIPVQDIIDAGNKYKDLCTQKKGELEAGYTQGVAQRDQSLKAIDADNAKVDQQMQDLNKKKIENAAKSKTILDEKSKLDSKKTDFNAAYVEVSGEIQSNLDKITQHLSAPAPVK